LGTLLRARPLVVSRRADAQLLIAGAGSRRADLEALAGSLGIAEHVRFVGFVPDADLPLYYQAADCFVLPTRELEGFGLVTVEALACGTPVLGTPVGATPELPDPLDPGLVFDAATPEAIGERLVGFLRRLEHEPGAFGQRHAAPRDARGRARPGAAPDGAGPAAGRGLRQRSLPERGAERRLARRRHRSFSRGVCRRARHGGRADRPGRGDRAALPHR